MHAELPSRVSTEEMKPLHQDALQGGFSSINQLFCPFFLKGDPGQPGETGLMVSTYLSCGFSSLTSWVWKSDCKVAPCYLKLLLGFCFLLCFFLIPLRQSRWCLASKQKKKKRHQVYKFCFVFFTFLTWDTRITACRKKSHCGIELARKAKS